jgi:hypothetical protein
VFVHFGIAKRETPMSGSQLSAQWEPAVSISEKWKVCVGASCQHSGESGFEDRESRGPYAFWHWKPRNPDEGKTVVMGIMVIWARSLARRASCVKSASGFEGSRILRTYVHLDIGKSETPMRRYGCGHIGEVT